MEDIANNALPVLEKKAFGSDFKWGVSTSAYQTEGAHTADGKGLSIWDEFSQRKCKIRNGDRGDQACDFYNRYQEDLTLVQGMQIPNFRFSISWPRMLPTGTGSVNGYGLDYYDRLIDNCLSRDIEPWVTLYHWDLPAALEKKGGWKNRDILNWFSEYVELCARKFGDRVKHWMVLNEPMAFVGVGYGIGLHAPGRRGMQSFLAATHHAALCQAEGGRILRAMLPQAEVGTTFSCSYVEPYREINRDRMAAIRVDALLNRIFIEPALGLGYPIQDLPFLQRISKYFQAGDEERLKFNFDFIGIQNYTREVVKHSFFIPYIQARTISAPKRQVPLTALNWEVYPEAIYHILHKYGAYTGVKKIIVTENGAAFPDTVEKGQVQDIERIAFLQRYLQQVLRAKTEGVKVKGYFIWSFTDNFEWSYGYYPRFGLVHVDFETQKRTVKASGEWYSAFINSDRL